MKEYPLRIKDKLYDICICGHGDFFHETVDKKSNILKEKCTECMCPHYEFEQKLNMSQLVDLKQEIFERELKA